MPSLLPSVVVASPLRPSEDPKKVERALRTVLPSGSMESSAGELSLRGDSLEPLRNLIWKEKILDAARRVLLGSLDAEGRRARFSLNKQAALVGHVSFAVAKAPLGDITVTVEGDDLEALFKEMAPPTLHGRPVSEEEYEKHLERQRKLRAARKSAPLETPKVEEAEE